jgi:hypothetical protein
MDNNQVEGKKRITFTHTHNSTDAYTKKRKKKKKKNGKSISNQAIFNSAWYGKRKEKEKKRESIDRWLGRWCGSCGVGGEADAAIRNLIISQTFRCSIAAGTSAGFLRKRKMASTTTTGAALQHRNHQYIYTHTVDVVCKPVTL